MVELHAPTHRLLCKQISCLKLREFAGHVIVQIAPAGCYRPLVLHQCKRTCFRVFNKVRPYVFQRFFQQVFTKWERNARNFESTSRQIPLFWLELPPSLSTLPITLLRHTPHSSHVIENRCHLPPGVTARLIKKKN